MRTRRTWTWLSLRALSALMAAVACAPVFAQAASDARPAGPGQGLWEIPDAELGMMRGRFIVGDNQVLWFGVSMISTWQTPTGQSLQGRLDLGFDYSQGKPVVSFMPSVSISAEDAPVAAPQGQRSVDSAGLANVSGLVQSVQVAGDGNRASNITSLTVREGDAPADGSGMPMAAAGTDAAVAGASASARFDAGTAQVLLQVDGHGTAEQWIRAGSLGQSIRLTGDGQAVSNQLHLDMVRQSLPANAMLNRNVAQAISMTRGIGGL